MELYKGRTRIFIYSKVTSLLQFDGMLKKWKDCFIKLHKNKESVERKRSL